MKHTDWSSTGSARGLVTRDHTFNIEWFYFQRSAHKQHSPRSHAVVLASVQQAGKCAMRSQSHSFCLTTHHESQIESFVFFSPLLNIARLSEDKKLWLIRFNFSRKKNRFWFWFRDFSIRKKTPTTLYFTNPPPRVAEEFYIVLL